MRWGCVLLFVAAVALGCRGQNQMAPNPFLGADRVPPPSTQFPAPGTAQPYYQGDVLPTQPNSGQIHPAPQPGPGQFQPGASPVTPPGGWDPNPAQPPAGMNPYQVQPTSTNTGSTLTGDSPLVRVPVDDGASRFAYQAQEAGSGSDQFAAVDPSAPWLTTTTQSSVQPVSTNHVPWSNTTSAAPPPQTPAVVEQSPATTSGDGFRPQGTSQMFTDPGIGAAGGTVASGIAAAIIGDGTPFSYDPQYTWLRGELNYSVLTGQWWLGYIPVGGMPDQFGGSIWIANPDDLMGLQSGDMVALQGHLVQREGLDGKPTTVFQVTAFQRQTY